MKLLSSLKILPDSNNLTVRVSVCMSLSLLPTHFFYFLNTLLLVCYSKRSFMKSLTAYCGCLVTYLYSVTNLRFDFFSDSLSISFGSVFTSDSCIPYLIIHYMFIYIVQIHCWLCLVLILHWNILKQTYLLTLSEVPVFCFLFNTVFWSFPYVQIMLLTDPEVESSLLISTDEGATYQKYRLNFYIHSLLFHPKQEDWILAYSQDQKVRIVARILLYLLST